VSWRWAPDKPTQNKPQRARRASRTTMAAHVELWAAADEVEAAAMGEADGPRHPADGHQRRGGRGCRRGGHHIATWAGRAWVLPTGLSESPMERHYLDLQRPRQRRALPQQPPRPRLAAGRAGPSHVGTPTRGTVGSGRRRRRWLGFHKRTHKRVQDREMKEGSRQRERSRENRGHDFPPPQGGVACGMGRAAYGTERMSGEGVEV
jgi:hypothetical protein